MTLCPHNIALSLVLARNPGSDVSICCIAIERDLALCDYIRHSTACKLHDVVRVLLSYLIYSDCACA